MSKPILRHVATRVLNTPLMIRQSKLAAILDGHGKLGERFGLDLSGQGLEIRAEMPEDMPDKKKDMPMRMEDMAVILVTGILAHRMGQMTPDSSMMCSYERLREDFNEALKSPDVKAIVFEVDSPGGEVAGVFDFADQVYFARDQKPIYAIINEDAGSAAYLIASAAQTIYIPRTGEAGSIGVVAVHTDQSGYDEKIGVKYNYIFAGEHKVDFSPHQKLSDSARDIAQGGINNLYEMFVATVARNRGIDPEAVRKTQARVYYGEEAVSLGLADKLMSFNEALADIAANKPAGKGKGKSMTTKEKIMAAMEGAAVGEVETAMAELGYAPVAARSKAISLEHAVEIVEMCNSANQPKMAADFIRKGANKDEVRKVLLAAKAEQDSRHEIVSTVSATNTGEVNPLMADVAKRTQGLKEGYCRA